MAPWAKRHITILLIIIVGGLIMRYFDAAYARVVNSYQSQLTYTAFNIELYLNGRYKALLALSADPNILDSNFGQPRYLRFQEAFKLHDISAYTPDGHCVASTVPSHLNCIDNSSAFVQALQGRRSISDRLEHNHLSVINIYTPIINDGQIKGVLAAGIEDCELAKLLPAGASSNQYFFILDGNGDFLYHPHIGSVPDLLTAAARPVATVRQTTAGSFVSSLNHQQVRKLYVFTSIPQTNWHLVWGVPLAQVYQKMFSNTARDTTALLIILVCLGWLYRISRRAQQYQRGLELMQLERLSCVNQMAAGIAHEIRNPLTSIKGFIQLMARKPEPPPPHHIKIILEEINRINQLINEFRQMAKPLQAPLLTPVDLSAMLDDIKVLMEGQATYNKVRITLNCPQSCVVTGDTSQLKQVWLNLLRNAIEAMPNGGSVDITLRVDVDKAIISFTDTGVGIPPEVLAKLGTPFFTTKSGGTGLGLAVCFNIIKEHAGQIQIDSQPNAGTTITVTLPLARIDDQTKL